MTDYAAMKMNIDKIITSYVASLETNGAILISGPWGIGKSFYWRNSLRPAIEKIPVGNKGKKYKSLYVSLNGITDTQEIMNQLLLEKVPALNNKVVKVGGKFFPGILKGAATWTGLGKVWDNISNLWPKGIRLGEFMSFENFVICFDDLERNNEQEKILGFINTYFVEKRNCKVILIGDESKIDGAETAYHKIKEKLIFRILQFDPTLVGLKDLIKKYQQTPFSQLLSNNANHLAELQTQLGNKNLRTWIFILDCLNQVYGEYPAMTDDKSKELAKSVIFFVVLIAIDFKDGLLQSHEAADFKSLDRLMAHKYTELLSESFAKHRRNQQKDGDDEKIAARYEMAFYDRNHIREHDEYFFFPSLYHFVLTGEFNESLFQEDLKDFEKFLVKRDEDKTSERMSMQAMQRANWIKTDEELIANYQTFLSHVAAGDYGFYNYGWMYDTIIGWIEDKLLSGNLKELEETFIEGCKKAKARNEHEFPFISMDENQRYTNTKSSGLREIIMKGIDELKRTDELDKRQEFIDAIKSESSYVKDRYYYADPFLYLTANELFVLVTTELQTIKNLNTYFGNLFKDQNIGITYKFENQLKEFRNKLEQWYNPESSGLFIHFSKYVLWQCVEIEKKIAEAKMKTE